MENFVFCSVTERKKSIIAITYRHICLFFLCNTCAQYGSTLILRKHRESAELYLGHCQTSMIFSFEHISLFVLVFLLLNLNMKMSTWMFDSSLNTPLH